MGAKICTSIFLRKLLLCSFKFSFVKVRKIKYRFVCVFFYLFGFFFLFFVSFVFCFVFLCWSLKTVLSIRKVAKFQFLLSLGCKQWCIFSTPLFFFVLFFPIVHSQLPLDTRTWLLLLNESTDTFLEAPFLPLSVHCCSVSFSPLSKLLLKTGSSEKIFCQEFIASLQLRFHFPQWALLFLLQLAFDNVLKIKFHPSKSQFTFLEIKTHSLLKAFLCGYNKKCYISTCDNQLPTLVNYQAHPADISN